MRKLRTEIDELLKVRYSLNEVYFLVNNCPQSIHEAADILEERIINAQEKLKKLRKKNQANLTRDL
jgi:hypothetical protein